MFVLRWIEAEFKVTYHVFLELFEIELLLNFFEKWVGLGVTDDKNCVVILSVAVWFLLCVATMFAADKNVKLLLAFFDLRNFYLNRI